MNKQIKLICCVSALFMFNACGQETKENSHTDMENPVDTYMDSRVNAIDMAKQSAKESNHQTEEQDKAMKALLGK